MRTRQHAAVRRSACRSANPNPATVLVPAARVQKRHIRTNVRARAALVVW